jgi:hypothetical protein
MKVTLKILLDNSLLLLPLPFPPFFQSCPVHLVGLYSAEQSVIQLSQASLHGGTENYLQLANYA